MFMSSCSEMQNSRVLTEHAGFIFKLSFCCNIVYAYISDLSHRPTEFV